MVNKKSKIKEEKYYFIPCLINENPRAIVFSEEVVILYKRWNAKEESWSIVPKGSVMVSNAKLRGDSYNHLRPALYSVSIYEREKEYVTVNLNDIDGRLVQIEKDKVMKLTESEAEEHLRNEEWIDKIYGPSSHKKPKKISREDLGKLVVDVSTGLISTK